MERTKIREIATGKVTEAWVLDAKESVATGRYEYAGKEIPKGKAATPEALGDPNASNFDNKDDGKKEDSKEEALDKKTINGMNTEELTALVTDPERNISIEGFEDLNLKEKRKAVIKAIFGEE